MLAKQLNKVRSYMGAAKSPLSTHPVFPIIVAAWFALLFGVGSLVLPITLIEALVTGTGLSSLISAAAPPLGTTTRIGIAIIAALAGSGIGLFLARKVAQANASDSQPVDKFDRNVSAASEVPSVKPISARDELGSEFLDDPVSDEEFFASRTAAPSNARSNAQSDARDIETPLELGEFTESGETPFTNFAQTPPDFGLDSGEEPEFAPANFVPPTGATRPYQPEAEQQIAEAPIAPESDPQETDTMPNPDDTNGYNPFAARAADLSDAERALTPQPVAENENLSVRPPPFGMPQPAEIADEGECLTENIVGAVPAEEETAGEDIEPPASALDGLSMAELVDRFSRSLKNRAAQRVESAAPVPLALQPVSFDDDGPEEDTANADFPDLALGETALDDDALEKGYSSLLAMKNPVGQKRDSDTATDKAVVTFPATEGRYAAPAADGPTRSPEETVQPPVQTPVQMPSHPFGSPEAQPQTTEPVEAAPQGKTTHEVALSEALEKLQRLSRVG